MTLPQHRNISSIARSRSRSTNIIRINTFNQCLFYYKLTENRPYRSQFENSRLSARDSEPLTVHDFWLWLRPILDFLSSWCFCCCWFRFRFYFWFGSWWSESSVSTTFIPMRPWILYTSNNYQIYVIFEQYTRNFNRNGLFLIYSIKMSPSLCS